MSASDFILFDTNILVYVQNRKSPFYRNCLTWHNKVLTQEVKGYLSSQNLTEFYSIITNKNRVEKPLSANFALAEIKKYQTVFNLIYPSNQTLAILNKLIKKYNIKARKIFDAFLTATMLSNGIDRILTYNYKDFVLFKEIKVMKP